VESEWYDDKPMFNSPAERMALELSALRPINEWLSLEQQIQIMEANPMTKPRPSGFTKYRLSNRIPTSAAEAERFLWHAIGHVQSTLHQSLWYTNPTVITLSHKIHLLQLEQEMQAR
jgi:hypothetical protein